MNLFNELASTCAAGLLVSLVVLVVSMNLAFFARRMIAGVRQLSEERWT